jgi:hypothetical protein
MRPRRFDERNCGPGSPPTSAICDCSASLTHQTEWPSGHIVIISRVADAPSIPVPGEGVTAVKIDLMQAGNQGAGPDWSSQFQTRGQGGRAGSQTGFCRLQIIELQPGGDPGTDWGLSDLNVVSNNRYYLKTANEAAKDTAMNYDTSGNPKSGTCCHDNWPTADSASVITC